MREKDMVIGYAALKSRIWAGCRAPRQPLVSTHSVGGLLWSAPRITKTFILKQRFETGMSIAQGQSAEFEMDAAEILHQLTHYERLPRAALLGAAARRAEMTPLFIDEIEKYVSAGAAGRRAPTPLFFIFHLLGDWRELSAYRPLAQLLRSGSDDIDFAIGDAITTTSHRVMAAVFDGDPQPLYEVVLHAGVDEFIRAHMLHTLVMLALDERLPRQKVEHFLRECFAMIEPRDTNFVWDGWQQAVANLGMTDMAPLVRTAFDARFIDPQSTDFGYFERDLQHALDHPDNPYITYGDNSLFGDTIEELSKWYGFTEQYERDRERLGKDNARREAASSFDERQPVVNLFKKVGRNEPCPCGSGRKFKKCCLT
jgi:hypothetical protein